MIKSYIIQHFIPFDEALALMAENGGHISLPGHTASSEDELEAAYDALGWDIDAQAQEAESQGDGEGLDQEKEGEEGNGEGSDDEEQGKTPAGDEKGDDEPKEGEESEGEPNKQLEVVEGQADPEAQG